MIHPPAAGEGGAIEECRRDVTLAAVVIGEPQPFDLVIVADHSASLAWSRDELSAGLSSLLTNVRGRSVRVFVLTPTQYGISSAAAQIPVTGESVVAWRDPDTGEPYSDAATRYEQACTDPDANPIECPSPLGTEPYEVQGSWLFELPEPVAVLDPEITDAEFAAEQVAVTERILAIGGSGSPEEQPLCTLSRYVSQPPEMLPANVVFLVISDEDDRSTPSDCLAGFTGTLEVLENQGASSPCDVDCDAYRFSVTGDVNVKALPYECAAFDDLGNLIPGSEESGRATQGTLSTCTGFAAGPCSADEERAVATFCTEGALLTSCQHECSPAERTCSVDFDDPSIDPCSEAFDKDGTQYDSLADYCANMGSGWRDCRGGGVNFEVSSSKSGSVSRRTLMPGSTTADLGRFFEAQAERAFSTNGYLLEAIVFSPEFSCELASGQSYATNLIDVVGSSDRVFPLCESYAPALEGVWDYAQALIQTEFAVTLKEDEDVTSVRVQGRDGSERELTPEQYEYDPEAATLSVNPSALLGTDASLSVEITSDCRPVVR